SPEQQADTADEIAGHMGIQPSSAPAHPFSELPRNIIPSAIDKITGLVDMIGSPQQTAEPFAALPAGAAREGARAILPEQIFNYLDSLDTSGQDVERQSQIALAA